ncbi:MAG TPA: hypothetical protein VD833_26085 [Vicinamibacterales bacterium]|nr:hypothetical protein [Vicinamibacterales bacterium]
MRRTREGLLAAALVLVWTGSAAAQQAPAAIRPRPPEGADRARALPQGFSVVLVLADLQASSAQDDVPPAARRALADMKDFLPYKSYKLLDAAWILGQGTGNTVTRLRGVDEQDYELRLQTSPVFAGPNGTSPPSPDPGRVSVRFTLADAPDLPADWFEQASGPDLDTARRLEEVHLLEAKLEEARRNRQEGQVRELERQIAELRGRLEKTHATTKVPRKLSFAGRAVIDTNFTMDVGETVVVGTSRLRGGSRALIVLLTAVPPKGRTAPREF